MKKPFVLRTATLTAALIAGLLAGCGGDNPETLIAFGKEFLAKKDNKAAVIQFKNALQQTPNLGEARFLLGKALLEGEDTRGAEVELRKARQMAEVIARAQLQFIVQKDRRKARQRK